MTLFDPGKLGPIKWWEVGTRFALGACVSGVAAIGGQMLGDRIGGALLAFPAVLPASITLASKKDGWAAAVEHERGALFGGAGQLAFALTLSLFATSLQGWAIAAAFAVWILAAFGAFFVVHGRRGLLRGAASTRTRAE